MAVNDVFKVALVGGLNSQTIVNTFFYKQSTANTSAMADVETLVRAFNALIPQLIANVSSDDTQWGFIEGRSFIPPGGPMVGFDLTISLVGDKADPACPPTVAVVIRKRTGFLGRKYRGRCYFAGIPTTDVSAGQISSGAAPDWNSVRDAMVASLTWTLTGSPTFIPVVAALDGSVIIAPVGVRATPITSCWVDPILRSQRRREIGVGA